MAKVATKSKSESGVTISFLDKDKLQMACDLSELSDEMVRKLAVHGLAQKVGDSYASSESVKDAISSAKSVWESLKKGVFNARSSGGSLVVEAVARLKGCSEQEAQDMLDILDDDAKGELLKKPQVKAMMDIIRGERANAKLAGLGTSDDLGI